MKDNVPAGVGIADVIDDTTPQLGGALDSNAHQVNWSKGSDVASAGALTLGTDGNYFDITGTTTITSIATLGIGTVVVLHFDGALTLTHQAADLILPGGANITTAAGDEAMFVEYASGDWRCVSYTKADGTAVAGGGATLITKSIADIATDINGASTNSIPASYFNNVFDTAESALIFREAGLSIANINAIIIHANISDDNAQQILSAITKANRDLTSADNIYEILDDWNDNKLTGRDSAGTVSTGFTNLFAQKDKFRPVWTVVSGTWNATGGKLVKDAAAVHGFVTTPSTFVVGTWEGDVTMGETTGDNECGFSPLYTDVNNFFLFNVFGTTGVALRKRVSSAWTTIITHSWTADTNPHTLKVTRDASSNWELFLGGASQGTCTDSAFTSTTLMACMQYSTVAGATDNLKVY